MVHDSGYDPVSYTHLDVYKRQVVDMCIVLKVLQIFVLRYLYY